MMKFVIKSVFIYFFIAAVAISCSSNEVTPSTTKNCKLAKRSNTQGTVLTYTYNSNGKVATEKLENVADPSSNVLTVFTYDQTGKLSSRKVTDASGKVVEHTFTYDANNKLEKMKTTPSNQEITFEYDMDGRIIKRTERPSLNIRTYTYDASGNLTSQRSLPRIQPNFTYVDLITITAYDNKLNSSTSIKDGYPEEPFTYLSPNNIVQWQFRTYPDGKIYFLKENIKYNSSNFPVSSTTQRDDFADVTSTTEYTGCN